MDIFDAIKTRRSIGKVKEDPVPKELIEKILETGTFAPNHHRTNPWRFYVLTGQGRERLGDVLAEVGMSQLSQDELVNNQAKIDRLKKNPLRAPVIIAVGVEPSDKTNVIIQEEFAAVHSCVQNMLLAAHSLGLGAVWRTGAQCYHPMVRDFFKLSDKGEIVAFIYIGYPDKEPPTANKTHYSQFTTWIEK
ncbi:nitroreductase family protein [Bacillus sp. Marseille-P3661]|uniref:nitroreductase family protein n=1 Tax=Bacillus sp. Marseille-P3661 TaxID=1936234 RepID=UPI000C83E3BA|nr:nitroreductase [Bacillus sp. Marseille-P3661]